MGEPVRSHPNPDTLRAFAAGRLDPAAAEAVERHLGGCEPCGLLLEGAPEDEFLARLRSARSAGATTVEDGPAPAAPPDPPAVVPPVVPGFKVERELGRGGMGVVYLACQTRLKRPVALKMILHGPMAGPHAVARFRTEAEAVARLQHPGIVQIHEVGEHDGLPWFALEYCQGGSLDERLAAGPLPAGQAAALVGALARAVAAAHERGVVHRDLKPANVLFAADGSPKVSDFGLAKLTDADSATRTGSVMGSPSYMAPEQAAGRAKEVGPAADVWALGAILYECLTGRPPFRGAAPLDTLDQVRRHEPVAPRELNPRVPLDLETICLKCLEKEPGRRYTAAAELADDLDRFARGVPVRARPVGPLARAGKWARKNPLVAGLTAAVAVACTAGSGVSLYYAALAGARAGDAQWHADHAAEREEAATREAGRAAEREEDARRSAELYRRERDEKGKLLRRAEGLRLTAHSTAALAGDPGLALLLAVEGARRAPGLVANDALAAALDACHETRTIPPAAEGTPRAVAFTPDGRRLYTTASTRNVLFWDAETGKSVLSLPGSSAGDTYALLSPDGRHAVLWLERTCQAGKKVYTNRVARVYDAATGRPLAVLRGHAARLTSVAFSPDGRFVATAGQDNTARIWELPAGREVRRVTCEGAVGTVRFNVDGTRLLTVAARSQESEGPATYPEDAEVDPPEVVQTPYWSSGGGYSFTANEDTAYARVWDAADGRLVATAWKVPQTLFWQLFALGPFLSHLTPGAVGGEFGADGRVVIALDSEAPALAWDPATGEVRFPEGVTSGPTGAVSPDGRLVVSLDGNLARVKEAATGAERAVLRGHTGRVQSATFSRDGRQVVTTSDDKTAKVWDAATGDLAADLGGHTGPPGAAAFSPDGTRVATASRDDGTARVWRVAPRRDHSRPLVGHTDKVTQVAYSPDGSRLLTASADSTVRLWDSRTGGQLAVLHGDAGGVEEWRKVRRLGPVLAAEFSPDGRRVLVLTEQQRNRVVDGRGRVLSTHPFHPARVFEAETGRELLALPACGANYTAAAFSPDGNRIAVGEADRLHIEDFREDGSQDRAGGEMAKVSAVRVLDARTGAVLATLPHHPGGVEALAFSPDGTRLATASRSDPASTGRLRVWDAATGRLLATGRRATEGGVAFSPDGTRVIAGSILFDAATGKELAEVKGDVLGKARVWLAGVHGPAGSPFGAGGRLLTLTLVNTAAVWDGATGRPVATLRGHQAHLCSAAFSPDGSRVLTASADRTARVWDAATGKELQRLVGHTDAVLHAALAPDGRTVATASADGTARLWRLDLLPIAEAAKPREFTPEERERYELPPL